MSEPELATRAPESDAAESSPFAGDTPAQEGASMGEHCVTDRPAPTAAGSPSGEMSKFGEIDVYISKPSDYPHSPSKLLLLLSSGTGVHSTNNQLQADKFAEEGFVVVMPDQFGGDPAPNSTTNHNAPKGQTPSLIEQVKLGFAETAKSFVLDMWLARQTPEKVLPILHKVLDTAKDEYADAIANGGGIYAAGYCFGAKYVVLLAGELPDNVAWGQTPKDEEHGVVNKGPFIKAGALAHATLVTKEDLASVKSPVTMVCVEKDQLFPEEILEAGRSHLESNNVEHEIKTYPGVPHGFAVIGEYEDTQIREAQKHAFDQMLSWLKSH